MGEPRFPTARWFNALGSCCSCRRRPATGTLMSFRNDKIGAFCQPCADREIKAADRHEQKQAHP